MLALADMHGSSSPEKERQEKMLMDKITGKKDVLISDLA
jgi:hypothetical protein